MIREPLTMAPGAQLLSDLATLLDEVIASAGLHRAEQHGHTEQGCDRDPMRRSSPGSACPSLLLHCEPMPIVREAGLPHTKIRNRLARGFRFPKDDRGTGLGESCSLKAG